MAGPRWVPGPGCHVRPRGSVFGGLVVGVSQRGAQGAVGSVLGWPGVFAHDVGVGEPGAGTVPSPSQVPHPAPLPSLSLNSPMIILSFSRAGVAVRQRRSVQVPSPLVESVAAVTWIVGARLHPGRDFLGGLVAEHAEHPCPVEFYLVVPFLLRCVPC
ncbi:MAG: hypothetical protein LC776_11315 [Acidobacteria bacterium]|nr:hypothetical protein [Acidobacteriota bacterium]